MLLFHFSSSVLPGGFLGVDLFFVLSGFLITSLLVAEHETSGRIRLPAFWARRARRLLPALFLLLAAVAAAVLLTADRVEAQHIAEDGLAVFNYLANWHFISSGQAYIAQFLGRAPSPLRHCWSLAIEEQFYIFWPLIVAAIGAAAAGGHAVRSGRRRRRFTRTLVAVCLLLAALSLLRMVSLYQPSNPNRVYYGTDSRAFVLLFGAALGALTVGAPAIEHRRRRRLVVGLGTVGALGIVAAMVWVGPSSTWLYEGGYGAIAAVMTAVLLGAVQPGKNPLRRLLETRVLVGLGVISYGVYLWHWPATVWLTERSTGLSGFGLFTFRCGATVAAALASFFLVEQPIRQRRVPRLKQVLPGLVPVTVVTVIAVMLLVPALAFPSVTTAPARPPIGSVEAVTAAYHDAPRCDPGAAAAPSGPGRPLRVELVGHSLAQEIAPCLRRILEPRGFVLETVTQNGGKFCDLLPRVQAQLRRSKTRPDIGILFAVPSPCSGTLDDGIRELFGLWQRDRVRIFFAPAVAGVVPGAFYQGVDLQHNAQLSRVATLAGVPVRVLDAGMFLRDGTGRYLWRMPCLPGERGCAPDHTVGVRFPGDGGIHFCADPTWQGAPCAARNAAGERRAAASLAAQFLSALRGGTDTPPP